VPRRRAGRARPRRPTSRSERPLEASPKGRRRVDFDADGLHDAPVFERGALPAGFERAGPLVVEDETTTALVHPGQTLTVDEAQNLVVWL
jgi:N-methylhydantoinase A